VAHLAERHGIRVRLKAAANGGLIAHVWLPGALISHDTKPASWDHIRPGRASAVIQAVTRTTRFPQDPAAATSLAEAPFAAAPLADTTPAKPPWEALRATVPPAETPATTPPEQTPQTTPLPEEEVHAAAAAEGTPATTPSDEQPRASAPTAETPAITPPEQAPQTTPLLEEEPHPTAPAEKQPHTTSSATEAPPTAAPEEAPATAPPEEAPHVAAPEPRQRPRETRLPIFEAVESDWFRTRRRPPARAGAAVNTHRTERSWISPSDEGWHAAETVLAPAVGGITASGLPQRTPRANLVPGSAGAREYRPATSADSAEVVSNRLASFQRGSRRARAVPRDESSDEQE